MINSKLLFIGSILSFALMQYSIQGQDNPVVAEKKGISIGLSLFGAYPFQYAMKEKNENLFYFEPDIKIPVKNGEYAWITSIGYANFSKDLVYNNLEYKLQGFYIKTGFESSLFEYLSSGIMACVTRINESGNFIFEGNYFDTYKVPFERTKTIIYMEPYFTLKIPVAKRFSIEPRVFLNLFFKSNDKYVPTYYIPGSGYWNNFNYLNANFDLKLFYQL